MRESHSLAAERAFRWHDSVGMPGLLSIPGVAGGWTFSFAYSQRHATAEGDYALAGLVTGLLNAIMPWQDW
ncbi:hypothetical protein [Streptomyces sp. Inha503]|uniref:hypothetical protein n=1 Tax=Streptomyces sp. Inha503 TaxID=3383314 RepID=UPI0039A121EC